MALVSKLPAAPVWSAAVWVASEALRARVPWGGLPWGRVGFGQPDGPFVHVAALGGEPLLSFVTVLAGFALGELARRALVGRRGARAAAFVGAPRAAAFVGAEGATEPASDGDAPAAPSTATASARALAVPLVIGVAALAAGPLAALVPPLSGGPGTTV